MKPYASKTVRVARITQLNEALTSEPAEAGNDAQQDEGGEGAGEGASQPGRSVAELKLLKSVQEELNARTTALAESRRQSPQATADQEAEFEQLSREQGRLADLVTNMMQTTDQRPEDNPADLPDIRHDRDAAAGDGATQKELP